MFEMSCQINDTKFGQITINGKKIDHDVVIRLSGEVVKRKKKLSKALFGTSHIISVDEAKFIYQNGADLVIIGAGQNGLVQLSPEAGDYFKKKGCQVVLQPTPRAIESWNRAKGKIIGMFHVTC